MDVSLWSLWLPILLSGVIVFIASALAWTVLPHHKPDWKGVPKEDDFLEAVRSSNIPAGQYMFPFCPDRAALSNPEMKKRYEAGPHGVLTVWPGVPRMGLKMGYTFIFFIVAGIFVAYITAHAAPRGAEYLSVFRISGTAAVMAYCLAFIPNAIWFGKSARSVVMDVIDGMAYGLLTAGIFGWLWPEVESMQDVLPAVGG